MLPSVQFASSSAQRETPFSVGMESVSCRTTMACKPLNMPEFAFLWCEYPYFVQLCGGSMGQGPVV